MALLKRELHRSIKGPVANDEDWWHLVFDTDTKRLYVEHRWAHVDVSGAGEATVAPSNWRSLTIYSKAAKLPGTVSCGGS